MPGQVSQQRNGLVCPAIVFAPSLLLLNVIVGMGAAILTAAVRPAADRAAGLAEVMAAMALEAVQAVGRVRREVAAA
ncbi:hypothetical protein DUP91_26815 [Salmonella enterica subsp. enterica]|nr:hypothetical protein [Salmonella enterica subsp. enterica]